MARKREVTRTINTTRASVFAFDNESKTVDEFTFSVAGNCSEKEITKEFNKMFPGHTLCLIDTIEHFTTNFRLGEDEFIKAATTYMTQEKGTEGGEE